MPRARAQKFSRSVKLHSTGVLTISGTFDVVNLIGEDRAFVFSLVDLIAEYQAAHTVPDNGGSSAGSAS